MYDPEKNHRHFSHNGIPASSGPEWSVRLYHVAVGFFVLGSTNELVFDTVDGLAHGLAATGLTGLIAVLRRDGETKEYATIGAEHPAVAQNKSFRPKV